MALFTAYEDGSFGSDVVPQKSCSIDGGLLMVGRKSTMLVIPLGKGKFYCDTAGRDQKESEQVRDAPEHAAS